jgi:hypothetical protein
MVTFEVRAGKASEALAALPRSAVEIDDRDAGGAARNAVPEAHAVDDGVVLTSRKARTDLVSRSLGLGLGLREAC